MAATHTCALTSAGSVKCWGANGLGQLGNGPNTNSNIPVDVIGLSGTVVAIAGGGNHSCVLTNTGAVQCWGDNVFGQLGNGTNTKSSTPVDVIGLASPVISLATGGHLSISDRALPTHTCAQLDTGAVNCWGLNTSGQLGNGNFTSSTTPVAISGLDTLTTAKAALSTSALSVATHTITATYAGDAGHLTSSGNLSQRVITAGLCTQEAKVCPNGSMVMRTGQFCEFAACPP